MLIQKESILTTMYRENCTSSVRSCYSAATVWNKYFGHVTKQLLQSLQVTHTSHTSREVHFLHASLVSRRGNIFFLAPATQATHTRALELLRVKSSLGLAGCLAILFQYKLYKKLLNNVTSLAMNMFHNNVKRRTDVPKLKSHKNKAMFTPTR